MILAAGLGKRLRPLTLQTPKPLFPVLNQPLIERLVLQLQNFGCFTVFINSFHLNEKLFAWQAGLQSDIGEVVLVKERELLGTGGGIENVFRTCAARDTSLLVINGDIVTDLDLRRLWDIHMSHDDTLASMVVHYREPWNKIRVDSGFITSFTHDGDDAVAFTGISVLSPRFLAGLRP
jgi:NDP-sugar pyrophosphorylase family protein